MKAKYFLAIVLDGEAARMVHEIKLQLQRAYGLKAALRSPPHVTLHRPFEWKVADESRLVGTLSEFCGSEPFNMRLSGFGAFGDRVLYVNVEHQESLARLQRNLARFCQKRLHLLNEVNDLRGFHPHVTVAFRDLKPAVFEKAWAELKDARLETSVHAGRFNLLKLSDRWTVFESFEIRSARGIDETGNEAK